jgi:hypothetical protein
MRGRVEKNAAKAGPHFPKRFHAYMLIRFHAAFRRFSPCLPTRPRLQSHSESSATALEAER